MINSHIQFFYILGIGSTHLVKCPRFLNFVWMFRLIGFCTTSSPSSHVVPARNVHVPYSVSKSKLIKTQRTSITSSFSNVYSVGKAITQFIIFLFTVLLCFFHNHKMPAWCKKIKGQGRTGVFFSQRNVWEIHPFNAYQNLKRQVKQVQNGPMSFSSCFIYVVLWIFILTQLTFLRKLLT